MPKYALSTAKMSDFAYESGLAGVSGVKRVNSRTYIKSLLAETPQKIASLCESLSKVAHISSPTQPNKSKNGCTKTPKINTFLALISLYYMNYAPYAPLPPINCQLTAHPI